MVLDFWATWCTPCIAAFPHLDTLQSVYRDKIQIVAVSDESPGKVEKYLQKRQHNFSFFTDDSKTLFKLFAVDSRPMTAVLQPDGTLIWIGNSKDLAEVIENPNSIHLLTVDALYRKYYAENSPQQEKYLYNYQVSRSSPDDEFAAKTQKGLKEDSPINIFYRSASIVEIVQDLLDVADLQITNNRLDLDTVLINLTANSVSEKMSYKIEKGKIIDDLQRLFNFTIKKEYKDVETYSLVITNSAKIKPFIEDLEGGGMVESVQNQYQIKRLSLVQLASFFEKKLRTFIQYPGSDAYKYNFVLEKFANVAELNHQLDSKYGLRLELGKASVLVVEIN